MLESFPVNRSVKGSIYGVVSAVSYGLNPLGALYLYEEGYNAATVLIYRFALAACLLAGVMALARCSFAITGRQGAILLLLGSFFGVSAWSLYESFHYMSAGLSCSLLFLYPIMVAVMMAAFFKERLTLATILSIFLALGGIAFLYQGDGKACLDSRGVGLVMLSAFTYAVYIVIVNRACLSLPLVKMTFYILLCCAMTIAVASFAGQGNDLQVLSSARAWGFALLLALVPSIISLGMMTLSVRYIGSTPTAIMGALEPITAVIIGCCLFGEPFTLRYAIGILLILAAVILIILARSLSMRRVASFFHRIGMAGKRLWFWKH